jgi:hypothetical protein
MSTAQLSAAGRIRLARRTLATTPGRLWVALGALGGLALVFFLAVYAGVREHRQALKTLGEDSAPSIIAAQSIKADLAEMHGHAAWVLLGEPGGDPEAVRAYEGKRPKVTEGLLAAAGNITYGDAERVPIRTLLNALGAYEGAVAQARVLHQQGDAGYLDKYREADTLLHGTLLPAADALDEANRKALNESYARQQASTGWALAVVVVSGAALLGALAATQVFLYRRMRRLVNPALAAATALAACYLGYTVYAFRAESDYLRRAKADAFDSIDVLWQARAVAHDAGGDARRRLLDPARAGAYDQGFRAKSARLMELPPGLSDRALLDAVARGQLPAGFKGYLAKELGNITFEGERAAAVATLENYVHFVAAASRVRERADGGKRDEAVALALGNSPGQLRWAFARFDAALNKTIAINHAQFTDAVARGSQALAGFDWSAPLAALGVAVLAFLGLRPRLKEYAV